MAKKRATLSDLLNDLTFRTIFEKYKQLAMSRFKWTGLDELNIEERYVERELFSNGICGFYDDPQFKYVALKAHPVGVMNVYGDTLQYNLIGHGYVKNVNRTDLVIIENNINRLATEPFVMFYVNKLAEAERTMDVNIKANKTPIVFACDDKDKLSFMRMFQMVDGNVPAIYADKQMNPDSIKAFDTKVKFLGNDLMDYKKAVEGELLTFLGVNNNPVEKRERLITDEANANNDLIGSFLQLQLEARQRACEEINSKYGLNVSVELRGEEKCVESVENSNEEVTDGESLERDPA